MVTVFRAEGLRVLIFVDDHRPAHVHVVGDGEAKVNLLGSGGRPELIWARSMTRSELRRAMRIVLDRQSLLIERWKEIHGSDE